MSRQRLKTRYLGDEFCDGSESKHMGYDPLRLYNSKENFNFTILVKGFLSDYSHIIFFLF